MHAMRGYGVPEAGYKGRPYRQNIIQDDMGGRAVPSWPGSPESVWCPRITADGTRCENKRLEDKDHCYAHAPRKVSDDS